MMRHKESKMSEKPSYEEESPRINGAQNMTTLNWTKQGFDAAQARRNMRLRHSLNNSRDTKHNRDLALMHPPGCMTQSRHMRNST